MPVTMKQLSEYCGISASAVSKALNNYSDVSEETRQRVLEAAEKLGYRPSAIARGLKTGRSFTLGVVYYENSGSGMTHNYFSPVLEAFKAEAEKQGFDITFISSDLRAASKQPMTYLEHARYRNVDGVCMVCCDFSRPQALELLKSDMPVVTIDSPFPGRLCVSSENAEGMRMLTKYVLSRGHRRIAYVYGAPSQSTKERLEAFTRTMREAGCPIPDKYMVESLFHNPQETRHAVKRLLNLNPRPTCILMPDDFSALGGMDAIALAGLKIPEDISIAGFDGVRMLQMCRPRITTVMQDTARIGQEAANALILAIRHPARAPKGETRIPTRLLPGETVLAPKEQ